MLAKFAKHRGSNSNTLSSAPTSVDACFLLDVGLLTQVQR